MQAASLIRPHPVYYEQQKDTIFGCQKEPARIFTAWRCIVCKMPVKKDEIKLPFLNSTAFFCCDECRRHYQSIIDKMKHPGEINE
ncbi:hypothetical protein GF327_07445 [Candidatus Woesearchaeota archaeon]|nr:hypothetical protein [Candidatus Woesearchaeota archaeon]